MKKATSLLFFLLFIFFSTGGFAQNQQGGKAQSQTVEAELVEVTPGHVIIKFYSLTSRTIHIKTTIQVFDEDTPKLQGDAREVKVTPEGVYETYNFPGGELGFYDIFRVTLEYRSEAWEIQATKFLYNSRPLPVTLQSFTSRKVSPKTLLTWATVNEINSSWFIVQRSEDGIFFGDVHRVKAAGFSSQERKYSFSDQQFGKTVYYRLKIIDLDGSEAYSSTIPVEPGRTYLYPITINGQHHHFEINSDEEILNVVVTDATGRREFFNSGNILTGGQVYGLRILYLVSERTIYTKKIIFK